MSHKSWNDPPKVSYSSFQQSAGKKSQLTKRPDYTVEQLSRGATPKASSSASLAEPPKSRGTPKPEAHSATEETGRQIKDIDVLLESLHSTIARYEEHLQKKVLDDIHKRVDCFAAQWKNKKLSDPVKLSMTRLVDGTALATDDYTTADQIHIKLMVDHISEVSQWMIGIKKLILAVRTNS